MIPNDPWDLWLWLVCISLIIVGIAALLWRELP